MNLSHCLKRSVVLSAVVASLMLGSTVAEAGSLRGPRKSQKQSFTVNGRTVQRVTPGSQSDPVSDFGLGVSGSIGAGGIFVDQVEFGSPAERVGLEQGDTILTVNNAPIQSVDDWINVMSQTNGFVRLRIRDVRSGNVVFRNVNLR